MYLTAGLLFSGTNTAQKGETAICPTDDLNGHVSSCLFSSSSFSSSMHFQSKDETSSSGI